MSNDLRGAETFRVSGAGGAIRLTTSSNVAVATALSRSVREVFVQGAIGNSSAVRVNINAAASAALGLVIPAAVASIGLVGAGYLRLSVPSVTCLQFYAGVNGDKINLLWRD